MIAIESFCSSNWNVMLSLETSFLFMNSSLIKDAVVVSTTIQKVSRPQWIQSDSSRGFCHFQLILNIAFILFCFDPRSIFSTCSRSCYDVSWGNS